MKLEHRLDRTVVIAAPRATVFRYFTDSSRFAAWWGEGSSIEPRVGGRVVIRYPGGTVASGAVVELSPEERIAFTYGYESGVPIPSGASRVTITLSDTPEGTVVALRHDLPDPVSRDQHVDGWRYQLGIFATVVGAEAQAQAAEILDRYYAVWREPDPEARASLLRECVSPDVEFRDRFGCVTGTDELAAHVTAARRHMPGMSLARDGDVTQCQGTGIVEWAATAPDGKVVARGTNVVQFAPDGRLRCITGLWKPAPAPSA
jgi:uncharacterized protein YndB with AHSA1/START domain